MQLDHPQLSMKIMQLVFHKCKRDISRIIIQNIFFFLKLFYPHELQESGEISILQIKSYDNLADLFIIFLPLATFDKCVKGIGMCRLMDL